MTIILDYWTRGCLIYDESSNRFFAVNSEYSTDESAHPHGIKSDTIIPSFTWEGSSDSNTPIELLGSGYVWTEPESETMDQKRRFSLLKNYAYTIFMEIQVLASEITFSGGRHKSWKIFLTAGYGAGGTNFSILNLDKTVVYEASGTESWDITFTASSLDSYFDYIKCEATGSEYSYPNWKATAIYTQVNPPVETMG